MATFKLGNQDRELHQLWQDAFYNTYTQLTDKERFNIIGNERDNYKVWMKNDKYYLLFGTEKNTLKVLETL